MLIPLGAIVMGGIRIIRRIIGNDMVVVDGDYGARGCDVYDSFLQGSCLRIHVLGCHGQFGGFFRFTMNFLFLRCELSLFHDR